jgi:butyrate kinase
MYCPGLPDGLKNPAKQSKFMRLILAINPGSTSTKFSLFDEEILIFEKTLRHTSEQLEGFDSHI